MNRKIVIICTVFAILLLGGTGYGFYKLFSSDSEGDQVADTRGDAILAVPSDAILIYDYASFGHLRMDLLDDSSPLKKFVEIIPGDLKNQGAIISIHYPSKNTIAPLFVISVKDEDERVELKDLISDYCSGVINKKYSGITIGKAVIPAVSYSFYGNYLIASPSHILVESSIRHLENRTSIADNPLYQKGAKSVGGDVVLHINHQNGGKFFSGAVNYDYLGKAQFFSSFASWSSFVIKSEDASISGVGKHINTKDEANFSNIFVDQKGGTSDIFDLLPHSTEYVITLPFSDEQGYLDLYSNYLEAIKKINDYNYLNIMAQRRLEEKLSTREWFEKLSVEEVAVASLSDTKGGERMTFVKMKDPQKMEWREGYLGVLLGDFFTPTYEDTCALIDEWIVLGSKRMTKKLSEQRANELYFSLGMYLDQTSAAPILKGDGAITGVVNMAKCADSLAKYFKKVYSAPLIDGFGEYNFNFLTFTMGQDGGEIVSSFDWFAENMAVLPQPPVAEAVTSDVKAVYDETVVAVPEGPFEVKNFVNGKKNYLQQMSDHKIRLLDDKKRGVWTIPFESPLCGYVGQVDHFKNNKLQMIFCSEDRLYMLDRLGRWVRPYPVKLGKNVLLGPKVYDFDKNRNYTLMVLHTDNTIGLYDMSGKPVDSWSSVPLSEKIKSLPEMLEVEGSRYWVIRTGYQTVICNENGIPVSEFTRKKRLSPETLIERVTGKEVLVTNVEGKSMVLNLQTGVMKKK